MQTVLRVEGLVAGLFLLRNRGVKLARGDFFRAGGNKAKLAGREIVLRRSHRRPEGATEDGPMLIEITGAMFKVKHRARLVVGKLLKQYGGLVILVEDAAMYVAGEPRIKTGKRISNTFANARCFFRISFAKSFESFAKARRIFLSDREDADATLGAARLADEVMAAAAHRVGERSVNNLY